jgi:orotidine-5'-phosphate decarboxylase
VDVNGDPAARLIVALDFPAASAALDLVDRLDGLCRWFKVGMELYYAAGNSVIERLRDRGFHWRFAADPACFRRRSHDARRLRSCRIRA